MRLSEPYDPNNLLDRVSTEEALAVHYEQEQRRERELLVRRLPLPGRRGAVGGLRVAPRPAPVPGARVAHDRRGAGRRGGGRAGGRPPARRRSGGPCWRAA